MFESVCACVIQLQTAKKYNKMFKNHKKNQKNIRTSERSVFESVYACVIKLQTTKNTIK